MLGGILNARSGLPVNVLIQRNDVVYVDGSGNFFNNPAAGRAAVINTPAAATRATCAGRTWCLESIPSSRTAASCS